MKSLWCYIAFVIVIGIALYLAVVGTYTYSGKDSKSISVGYAEELNN